MALLRKVSFLLCSNCHCRELKIFSFDGGINDPMSKTYEDNQKNVKEIENI